MSGSRAPFLLTPGPTNVPERVLAASARPIIHHRTAEFSALLGGLIDGLKPIFGTTGDVLILHTTGRGGLEASITNLFAPGDDVLSVVNGRFGLMYADIAARYGLKVHHVCTNWASAADLSEVRSCLAAHPEIRAITVTQNESSTGVVNDIAALGKLAREFDKLLLVDTVSSLGGTEFRFDDWGVDICVTASQKCLMGPTGLAFIAVSQRAWQAMARCALPHYYEDLSECREKLRGDHPETPGSTPGTLVAALAESVTMIHEEGLAKVFARHRRLADAIRAGLTAMGVPLYPGGSDASRSATVTAFMAPAGAELGLIRSLLLNKYGLLVAEGLGQISKTTLRIGHMGAFYEREALLTVSAFEAVLLELGAVSAIGPGVTAFTRSLLGG